MRVDFNSPASSPDGSSWDNAYQDLQQALGVANAGDQIWIANGTYKPTSGTDRTVSFQLKEQVSIYGGYAGFGAPNPDSRDIAGNPTILSGEIGDQKSITDNSYHVVFATFDAAVTSATTIDGITITAGYSNNPVAGDEADGSLGGGMFLDDANPLISNCTFLNNDSDAYGGAVMLQRTASPTFISCAFINNANVSSLYIDQGGAVMAFRGSPSFTNCSFTGNSTLDFGGAIMSIDATITMTGCTFTRNSAVFGGALSLNSGTIATVANCQFDGNIASRAGGAAYVRDMIIGGGANRVTATFTNCLIVGNSQTTSAPVTPRGGGAMYIDAFSVTIDNCDIVANSALNPGGGIAFKANGTYAMTNSVVRGNTASTAPQLQTGLNVTYTDVEGGFTGTGNIDADAQFVRNPSPGADAVWGTSDDEYGDLREQITSPTVDVGDNSSVPAGTTTDIAGNTRFYDFPGVHDPGAIVDMGAYELTNHLGLLHVGANQTLALPAGDHIFFVEKLQIDSHGTLDVMDDDLILDYSGATILPAVQAMINSARTGNWSGTGITSSTARTNPKHNTTLGAMEASDYKSIGPANQTFDGEAIDNSAVVIKYTYYGDANFDGRVDGGDYSRIDSTFNKEHTAGNIGGWLNGDFNGDGMVDGADYSLIDGAFNSQGNTQPRTSPALPIRLPQNLRLPASLR